MKIVVMGTGPFAVPTAKRLLSDGHEISLVVTRPLVGRSKKPPPRPVYDWACEEELPLFEPASINTPDSIERLTQEQADLFFVCDYGQILSNECLKASRCGGINLHGSLLPRHRGAAPVQWALLRGDEVSGVTVIHMTPKLDAGPALAIRETNIHQDETAGELEPRLAEMGVEATLDAVRILEQWDGETAIGEVQEKSLVTKAPRFDKRHGQLDFRLPAEYLVRLVRACQPWPGTYAEISWPSGKKIRLIIRKARAVELAATSKDLTAQAPGRVFSLDASEVADAQYSDWSGGWEKTLAVETGDQLFLAGIVQPSGKREMVVSEFLRGHPLEEGCQFQLPAEPNANLDEAIR